ncbi:DUF6969 family protein [Hahella ganghwensis]|uniref:DUF6969 family protein n=1 Tax=Hahella ganghwensis TaxID=286420 RepID=UPI0003A188A1|nr:hypothetical protein [Hahella ganghwensis]
MNTPWSSLPETHHLLLPDIDGLHENQIICLKEAATSLIECYRLLEKAGINIVGEILKGQGTFYEMDHYPKDDVYDNETHAQYYYHAHRNLEEEHGHFHTFLRAKGYGREIPPAPGFLKTEPWPEGGEALCHFVGVSMDRWGYPIGLFATNRWVTDQTWYSAETSISLLDKFRVEHAHPNLVVNLWITQLLKLFKPHIEHLLYHRDQVIESWRQMFQGRDVLEDRELEVTGYFPIDSKLWANQVLKL